jgi:SAM-dependent methyltransferase
LIGWQLDFPFPVNRRGADLPGVTCRFSFGMFVSMSEIEAGVTQHYSSKGLTVRILAALREVWLNPESLAYTDLAPLDQFHTRGRDATLDLADVAQVREGMRVLDVGCGIGGPARLLAAEFGCQVTGIDLTAEFCETAAELSRLAKVPVEFRQANALDLPFPAETFDLVWTQHVSMNVEDKDQLYREAFRVLKPGGRLALYDVVAGEGGPLHFPVPWAARQEFSFLIPATSVREKLEGAGFHVLHFEEGTAEAIEWFQKRAADGPRKLSLQLVMGGEFSVMVANQIRNLAEGRAGMLRAVCEK